jgi:cytochrome c-type biogenesis protein CcsB
VNLEPLSLTAAVSAIALYGLAFIAFAMDLGTRAVPKLQLAVQNVQASAQGGGYTTVLEAPIAVAAQPRASRWGRVALAFTIIGFALNAAAVVTRGLAGARVPWANMYEFALTGIAIIVGVFLVVLIFQRVLFLGVYVVGLSLLSLVLATVNFYVTVAPLPPALQSVWIVIHVFVAILGTAFFGLAAGLSIVQLLQARREAGKEGLKFLTTLPGSENLENLAYRLNLVGFVFWTFTLIFGAIWASLAWGRYWGWDTKEVWTFIIWVIFAGYIHARATRGWRGARSAWLAIIGFAAVLFNFTIVNLFFKGLHAYSGL